VDGALVGAGSLWLIEKCDMEIWKWS
jgi:hypothetical protein